jgi:hypothetical protein
MVNCFFRQTRTSHRTQSCSTVSSVSSRTSQRTRQPGRHCNRGVTPSHRECESLTPHKKIISYYYYYYYYYHHHHHHGVTCGIIYKEISSTSGSNSICSNISTNCKQAWNYQPSEKDLPRFTRSYSTPGLPRYSLVLNYHTVSWHSRQYSFIWASQKSTVFPQPIFTKFINA